MNCKELRDAHRKYLEKSNWNRDYINSIKRRDVWGDLEHLEEKEVSSVILNFLNKWKCHIPYKRAPEICKALKHADRFFGALRSKKLETVDFEKAVGIDSKAFKTQEIIGKIFRIISPTVSPAVAQRGYTATSKIMHMINPELFPMWDDNIRKVYGSYGNTEDYLSFMLRMQTMIKGIVKNYCEEFRTSKKEAKEGICKKICGDGERLTLVKLLDEYNYTKFTLNEFRNPRYKNG